MCYSRVYHRLWLDIPMFIMIRFFTFLAFLFSWYGLAQEPQTEDCMDKLLDELLFEDGDFLAEITASMENFHFLYLSVDYNSDTYFAGRDIGTSQFNMVPQITYINSNGLSAGVSGVYYDAFDPKWDVTIASVAYGNYFGKKRIFRYQSGYSRWFYSTPDVNVFKNAFDLGLGIRNKKRNLGTQVTATLLTGEEVSFQLLSRSFAWINLRKGKNSTLRLSPQLSFIAGEQVLELSRTFSFRGREVEEFYEENIFDLFNTQLNIPVQWSMGDWDFEIGYTMNFPNPLADEEALGTNGFFNISLAYLIDL